MSGPYGPNDPNRHGVLVISSSRTSSSGGRILSSRADNSSLVSSPASNSRGVSLVKHRSPVSSPASNSRGDNLPTASRVVSLRTVSRSSLDKDNPASNSRGDNPSNNLPHSRGVSPGNSRHLTQPRRGVSLRLPHRSRRGAPRPPGRLRDSRTSGTRLSRSRVPVRPETSRVSRRSP